MTERKWKRGDIGPDGRVFERYQKDCKNGERWVTPERFAANKEADRLAAKNRRNADPEKFRQSDRERREKSPNTFQSRGKQRYALNPEKYREKERARYQKNPEKKRKQKRDCRAKNPDLYRKIEAARRKRDPEKTAAHNRQNKARRRSKISGHKGVTAAEWKAIKVKAKGLCHYCGGKPSRLTMDHVIPVSKGGKHEPSNVVPACGSCNSKKKNQNPEQFALTIGRLVI